MSLNHVPRRRLTAAVTVVLAVTAGAALTTAPATAAPAPVGASTSAASATAVTVADDIRLVSAGSTGFLSRRTFPDFTSEYRWTSYADGTTKILDGRTQYSGGRSDYVVGRKDTESSYTLYDMADPGARPIGLTNGDSRYSLAGVSGQSLVMTAVDSNGALDAFLMSRPSGYSTSPTTRDVALPFDARDVRVAATLDGTALLQYRRGTGAEAEFHLAAVELATGTITETVPVGTKAPRTGVYLTADRFAWVENTTGTGAQLVTVPRGGGDRTTVPLGATIQGAPLDLALVGGWAVTGQPGGGSATDPSTQYPLTARSLTSPNTQVRLLDHVDSMVTAPDGSVLVRGGSVAAGEGVYRIAPDGSGTPVASLVATTGRKTQLDVTSALVPGTVDLDASGGRATLAWTLNRSNAQGTATLRHVATGKKAELAFSGYDGQVRATSTVTMNWGGLVTQNVGDSAGFAPSGAYVWELRAKPLNGIGPDLVRTGTFKVLRKTGLHDHTDNGSPDLLARDAAGGLFRDDTVKTPSSSEVYSSGRTRIGTGWQIYNQLEAVGNIAGGPAADVVARDASGVLWQYLGKGDGTFAARTRIGAGWNAYNKITGGSDLDGDGRPDLLAVDTGGVLWFYKGTGKWDGAFAARVRVGGGWNAYNQITAVGNIAGSAHGDLVARDTAGVLWLHQGNGSGGFAARVRIGSGWGSFTSLVGAGDLDRDGLNDLYAVGASGSRLYSGTGSATAPFKPGVFTSVHSDAASFNSVF
ncbi:FG-GAP repeat domain-containing protein [Streptomyces sp. NPDC059695]|uniref:FG-GAP repeat domain-containing protein n=1 Tax=Streptomyces sp. NPDC059695 TaxID=3346910 RepID=UPI0036CB02D3